MSELISNLYLVFQKAYECRNIVSNMEEENFPILTSVILILTIVVFLKEKGLLSNRHRP